MIDENILYKLRLYLIIILALFIQLFNFNLKEVYHIDELFSYGMANNQTGVYIHKEIADIDNKLVKSEVFHDYLTQTPNSSYKKMWNQLSYDCHMPLYFLILRFVNSFFPPQFTNAPGIIVNCVVLFFLLISFYYLSQKIFKDKEIALASLALFAFSSHILSLEVYVRMYLLQICLSVFLILKTIELLDTTKAKNSLLVSIMFFSLINILTHFYSIIFCFTITLSVFLILLKQKRHNDLIKFLLVMLCSAIFAYVIFPEMIKMGTEGERGGQFVSILKEYTKVPLMLLKRQLPLFMESFFVYQSLCIIVIILSVIIFYKSFKKDIVTSREKQILSFFSVLFFVYGLLVTLVMPNMTSYKIRYFAPIIPVFFILLFQILISLKRLLNLKNMTFYCFIWLIVGIIGFYEALHQDSPFYLRGTDKSRRTERLVQNADIWWGLGGGKLHSWIIYGFVDKLAKAKNVWTLVDLESKEFLKFANEGKKNGRYAYLFMPKTQEQNPTGGEIWVEETTNRKAYYLYTLKHEKTASMAIEASIYLVAPY